MTAITRLLIANRGEIATRIAATARRMGIVPLGVYSDADATALHTTVMDGSVHLGGAAPKDSYLDADKVIAAARRLGCDAIHPGYGFLAENADFAAAVEEAGLIWVGPTPEQIRTLGDKISAKRAAIEAGVPTTTVIEVGSPDAPLDVSALVFPALVKAAAGGGGRGMRLVRSAEELPDALAAAAREAESAFGDPTVFVEPYIERGRHIEVQIAADSHGNVVSLGERECSIQRRNQKVIEEAPSAGISEAVRQAVCQGAIDLIRHVGYRGLGTVEFMVGADESITFLEVNTRLQVEHPVTEAVTGLDLVELALRIAEGAPLPLTQDDVVISGHAIEARLVAEDPASGWVPSTGTIERVRFGAGIRVDSGVADGSVIGADYDSLVAKLIAHAPDRATAARVLARACSDTLVVGLRHNAKMLAASLTSVPFLAADTPVTFLADNPSLAVASVCTQSDAELFAMVVALFGTARRRRSDAITGFAPAGWRNVRTIGQRISFDVDDQRVDLEYVTGMASTEMRFGEYPVPGADGQLGPDERRIATVHAEIDWDESTGGALVAISTADVLSRWSVEPLDTEGAYLVSGPGRSGVVSTVPRFADQETTSLGSGPVSPLPGTVLSVHVNAGDSVVAGQLMVVVEAMKMEHSIAAVTDASVAEVCVAAGDRVDTGQLLVRLADPSADVDDAADTTTDITAGAQP